MCYQSSLTLKAPITTAADYIHKYFFIVFQRKQDLMFQVNPLLGTAEDSHKNQALFSLKDKCKKLKCHLLQFSFGTLRVKMIFTTVPKNLSLYLPPPSLSVS